MNDDPTFSLRAADERPPGPVVLNDWYRRFDPHTVGGSIYAVPAAHRIAAARVLDASGCRVHVDVIVGPHGHRGVGWAELIAVRTALPSARIDLHLIIDDAVEAAEDVRTGTELAQSLDLAAVTVSAAQIRRHRRALDRLRASGIAVYEEIRPAQAAPTVDQHVDGALVMLIPPGTRQAADPAQLDKITTLAATMPVAVDGGVTRDLATQCHRRGAGYLVSGRDLLTLGSATGPSTNGTRTKP